MSCMVQVALQINISRFAESTEVLCWLTVWTQGPQIQTDKPVQFYSACKAHSVNVSNLRTHVMATSLKHTTMRHRWRLQNFFSHFVYWNSKFVIIAPIAMETGLSPKPTGIIQCRSVCSLPFTASSRNQLGWMGDSASFGKVREYADIQIIFHFPTAFHTCSLQTPYSHVPCSLCSLCHVSFNVCHKWRGFSTQWWWSYEKCL